MWIVKRLFPLIVVAGTAFSQQSTPTIQNAVLEGIQVSTDKGATPDEVIVNGYFIFRDNPMYTLERKYKPSRIVFYFTDAQLGSTPIPSFTQAPIAGFTIDQKKEDVNKAIRGLNPEYHDLLIVTFNVTQMPQIESKQEYSVVTFTYKWSTDPLKLDKYVYKEKNNHILLWSASGVGALAGGAVAYFYWTKKTEPPLAALDVTDLPLHQNANP